MDRLGTFTVSVTVVAGLVFAFFGLTNCPVFAERVTVLTAMKESLRVLVRQPNDLEAITWIEHQSGVVCRFVGTDERRDSCVVALPP